MPARRDISQEDAHRLLKLGYRVFTPEGEPLGTYLYYSDGERIGYLQAGEWGGYRLSTVHIPNKTSGTGYSLNDEGRDWETLSREELEACLRCVVPSWHYRDPAPQKYPDLAAFLASREAYKRPLEEWRGGGYLRGRTDYHNIQSLAADPEQEPVEVSSEEFYDMLGCVPPLYVYGVRGFLVGETLTEDPRGKFFANYFEGEGGKFFARYHLVEGVNG